MDKYFKIQKIVELQQNRKKKIEEIFLTALSFVIKLEIEFLNQKKLNYKNMGDEEEEASFLVKVKVKDKSSVRFAVNQSKEKIIQEYQKQYPQDFVSIV